MVVGVLKSFMAVFMTVPRARVGWCLVVVGVVSVIVSMNMGVGHRSMTMSMGVVAGQQDDQGKGDQEGRSDLNGEYRFTEDRPRGS